MMSELRIKYQRFRHEMVQYAYVTVGFASGDIDCILLINLLGLPDSITEQVVLN